MKALKEHAMQSFIKPVLLAVMLVFSAIVMAQQPKLELEKYYESSGNLQFEYEYHNGKLHGTTKEYYESGEIKAELIYKKGRLTAKKQFRRNGDLEYELKYKNGKKLETKIEYYSTGEPFRQRIFIDGKREDLEIEYYKDGQTKAERNYVNGKKEGSARGYYTNGRLQGDWLFKNDEPISATLFYKTGEKWINHNYFDNKGRLNGVSKEYNKEGKLMALRYYQNNDMVKRKRVGSGLRWWWELRY
ncbi:MAG: hypothetical protein DRQ49_10975 [Gammaproteobacteria bacterium]|nr:MAG: hypothetical protein DRQ49_10975 [Gammaproteobacteria bacterium]RKZ43215.1 MAG: hypothetical protein DRQ41_05830 [Gammaproteobacteria bacterium]RKZ75197.1 MAG: hypothetical protein DRQ57_08440 [Gammaproteobacteria bacterium]